MQTPPGKNLKEPLANTTWQFFCKTVSKNDLAKTLKNILQKPPGENLAKAYAKTTWQKPSRTLSKNHQAKTF